MVVVALPRVTVAFGLTVLKLSPMHTMQRCAKDAFKVVKLGPIGIGAESIRQICH